MIGLVLTGLLAVALIGIGGGALAAARRSSEQYGIVLEDPRALAFLRAMGVRDLVIGVLLLLLVAAGRRELLALGVLASAAVAVLDFVLVARDRPPAGLRAPARARMLHAVGALGVLAVSLVIALGW